MSTTIPRPILLTVVSFLGAVAVFALVSGFLASWGKHRGFAEDAAPATAAPAGTIIEARPMDPSAAPISESATDEEAAAANKAADDDKKAKEQDKVDPAAANKVAAGLPKAPVPYIPPPPVVTPAPGAAPVPGPVEGPPPATPEQTGPGLY